MDDDETRNSADLLTDANIRSLELYVWRGQELKGHEWTAVDPPDGGDSVRLGSLDIVRERDVYDRSDADARYVAIPETAWGDYTGSTYQRSNARSIRRDHGDHVITLTADFGFEMLLIRVGADIPESLYDAVVELRAGHLLYDESDLSELESELEQEDWVSWGRNDFKREIVRCAQLADPDDDVPELGEADDVDNLFWDVTSDGDVSYWQAETAVSGYWTDFERAADLAYTEIQRRRMSELEAWACSLAAPIPGQLALAI